MSGTLESSRGSAAAGGALADAPAHCCAMSCRSAVDLAETVSRPVLRWHGGKWLLAPWIIQHFPEHRLYCEPIGGAASVLLRKPRAYAEVYNDLDDEVVNLFRVLRSADAPRLRESLRLTPFARSEFDVAMRRHDDIDSVERARLLIVRSFMGFGSNGHNRDSKTGFRATSNRSGTTPAHDWANYPDCLDATIERLRGVVIEHRDAREVMTRNDGMETLFFVDPPYLPETRSYKAKRRGEKIIAYSHEMSRADHVALLDHLRGLSGMVALSGYPSALYDDSLAGWRRVERAAHADGARDRTEVLWLNAALFRAIDLRHAGDASPLFTAARQRDAQHRRESKASAPPVAAEPRENLGCPT